MTDALNLNIVVNVTYGLLSQWDPRVLFIKPVFYAANDVDNALIQVDGMSQVTYCHITQAVQGKKFGKHFAMVIQLCVLLLRVETQLRTCRNTDAMWPTSGATLSDRRLSHSSVHSPPVVWGTLSNTAAVQCRAPSRT